MKRNKNIIVTYLLERMKEDPSFEDKIWEYLAKKYNLINGTITLNIYDNQPIETVFKHDNGLTVRHSLWESPDEAA